MTSIPPFFLIGPVGYRIGPPQKLMQLTVSERKVQEHITVECEGLGSTPENSLAKST